MPILALPSRRAVLPLALAPFVRGASRGIRLGGPIFLKSDDPAVLAREHRRLGYSAAYCPASKAGDSSHIEAIRRAFAAEDVVIAEVGAFGYTKDGSFRGANLLDPDSGRRKETFAFVQERLALADEVGARNCVDIAGSYNPKQWDGPDPRNLSQEFFDATVENCRTIIDAVKPKHTKFTIEMMGWSLPDSPESYFKLLKAVDRSGFAVHIDICNIVMTPELYYGNAALIEKTFRSLGKWTASCHAKDLAPVRGHFAETIPGRGGIDYRAYLTNLRRYAPDAPLMLEHLRTAEEYEEGKQFILKTGRDAGMEFA